MDKSKRNRNANKNPSYKARNMSEDSIRKKRQYDKAYHATTERKKYRAELNKKNRENHKAGKSKVGDGKDVSHTKKRGTTLESQKKNRARNGSGKGGTRKSTKK